MANFIRGDWGGSGPSRTKKKNYTDNWEVGNSTPSVSKDQTVSFYRPPIKSSPAPAPYSPPQAPAPSYPIANDISGYTGNGGGSSVVPIEPPKPEPIDYSKYNNDKLGAVDGVFDDQRSMLTEALKKYLADITRQKQGVGADADTALAGINRNEQIGLTNLSEDFASRGLVNSGLFAKAQGDATDAYSRQEANVTTQEQKALKELEFQAANRQTENKANIQSARMEALARLSNKQALR